LAFIKNESIKEEYSETYRKTNLTTIYNSFEEEILKLNYKNFSNLPLILYKDLFFFILKLSRVLSIPKRHILFYGGR